MTNACNYLRTGVPSILETFGYKTNINQSMDKVVQAEDGLGQAETLLSLCLFALNKFNGYLIIIFT